MAGLELLSARFQVAYVLLEVHRLEILAYSFAALRDGALAACDEVARTRPDFEAIEREFSFFRDRLDAYRPYMLTVIVQMHQCVIRLSRACPADETVQLQCQKILRLSLPAAPYPSARVQTPDAMVVWRTRALRARSARIEKAYLNELDKLWGSDIRMPIH